MIIKSSIAKTIQRKIGNYNFEVGILSDKPKKIRKKGASKTYAGMQISAMGKSSKNVSLVQVAGWLEKYHFKWLRKPFSMPNNQEVAKVVKELAAQVFGKKSEDNKRLENAVQAVIRNPILRGDYGGNAQSTQKQKGFNKLGIDTGQFFKSIKAKRI